MKTCVIFSAGEFDRLAEPVTAEDYIIAADGGWLHPEKLGLRPHEVLGDFDSLGCIPPHARVFPVEKDDTDTMLAVRRGLELGYRRFVIYGGMDGPRIDHTLANFQTLQFLAQRGATGYLVGKTYTATVVREETVRFPSGAQGVLSLFCMGPDARGVTLRGLKYPLEKGCLTGSFPLGVSNRFMGEEACITVEEGSLLMLWDSGCGFPERE